MKKADLSPPLGYPGGPCYVVDRIRDEVRQPALSLDLSTKVQHGDDITNPEANAIYDLEKERGVGAVRGILITPHAQYRMDLRGITVGELRLYFTGFQKYLDRVKQKDPYEFQMFAKRLKFGEEINWTDPKLKLTVVFVMDAQAVAKIITTYWQGVPSPKPEICKVQRKASATTTEDLFGYKTFVSQNPASPDSPPQDSASTKFYNSKHDMGSTGYTKPTGDTYNATPGRGLVEGDRYQVIPRTDPNRAKMQGDDAGRVTAALEQQYTGQFVYGPSDVDPEFEGYPSESNSQNRREERDHIGDNTPVFTSVSAPGSARVIPYVTETEFASRMAAKSADILKGLDPGVRSKAVGIKPKLTRVDQKNRMWTFTVPSSKDGNYVVKVKGGGNAVNADKMDLKISCTCKDWVYGGPEHWAKVHGYLYGKPQGTAEEPTKRDPGGVKRVCKHVVAVLQKLEGYSMGTAKKASLLDPGSDASVFMAKASAAFHQAFPRGEITMSFSKSLSTTHSISIRMAATPKSEWANGIWHNDPLSAVTILYGFDSDGNAEGPLYFHEFKLGIFDTVAHRSTRVKTINRKGDLNTVLKVFISGIKAAGDLYASLNMKRMASRVASRYVAGY